MEFLIEQRIDLAGVNPVYRYDQPMEYGDGGAHRWIVWASKRGEKADLKNLTAKCFLRRAASAEEKAQGMGSVTVIQEAQVDAESGSVSCLFDKACYAGVGAIAAVMRVYDAESHVVAAAKMTGVIERNTSDTVYDPSGLIPSLDELLAQISAIEAATKAANEAAAAAQAAADSSTHPPYIDAASNHWFVWNVSAGKYADTGVPATGPQGLPGDDAPIPYIGENGNWFVAGADTGTKAQGPAGANGAGSGTVTGVRIGDAIYEPDETGIVLISNVGGSSLPAGGSSGQILAKKTDADGDAEWVDPPEGTMKSVCGKEADESGNVDLDAADVGAVSIPNEDDPTYGVATGINADMLGGVAASEYAKKSEIPEASTGLPAGGSAGQVLTKNSDADDDAVWADPPEAGEVDWDSINNKPDTFTPSAHTHDPVIATADTLGCVKVGDGLSVAADGTISANTSSGVKAASEMKFICFSSQDLYGGMRQYINDPNSDVTYNHLYVASMMITDIDQYFIVQSVSASSGRAYIMVRRIWDSEEFPDNLWFNVIYD